MARRLRAPPDPRAGPSCRPAVSDRDRGRALLMPWSRQDDCRASGAAEVGWGAVARPIGPIDRTPARRTQPYSPLVGRALRRGVLSAPDSRRPARSGPAVVRGRRRHVRNRGDPGAAHGRTKWSSKTRKCQAKWCVDIGGSVRLCRNQRASDTWNQRGIASSLIRIRHIMEHYRMDRFAIDV